MALLTCHFFSEALGVSTAATVLLPESARGQIGMGGADVEGPPPVLYLLHGLSDDETIWTRRTSIERYVAERGLAVVMPRGGRSMYADEVHGGGYWTFLTQELPRAVQQFFRVSDRREDTFVAGLSMGGYGAFKWALREPWRFAAAASLSGALVVGGERARFVRKQATQLASKMRFIGAQFEALLTDDLWLRSAGHANAMAVHLADGLASVPGVGLGGRPEVNAVFATLPSVEAVRRLQEWSFVWDWDVARAEVRCMTSFATTPDDVERFVEGVRAICSP